MVGEALRREEGMRVEAEKAYSEKMAQIELVHAQELYILRKKDRKNN